MKIQTWFFIALAAIIVALASAKKYPGESVTILSFGNGNSSAKFDFQTVKLQKMLEHKSVTDREVVVISIVGAFRKGKSFILDYFLRYLYTNYKSVGSSFRPFRKATDAGWIGDKSEALQGFSWKGGATRHTTGLIFWSDVFLYDAPNGDKIAILLMDTQGLFDHESSPADNSRIFSISALLTSVQIYNLAGQIQENELEYLQFATDFAKYVTNVTDSEEAKPFQNLLFLIRDWNFEDDHAYGLDGGQDYLDKILEIKDTQKPDLKSLRQYIYRSFDNITCFLLPHPGRIVASKSQYNGSWSAIETEFVDNLKDLVINLLAPENLKVKKINGETLRADEYFMYVSQYVKMYESGSIPEAKSLYGATVANHMNILMVKSMDSYNQIIQQFIQKLNEIIDIQELQDLAVKNAFKTFTAGKKMGSKEDVLEYQNTLKNQTQASFESWQPGALKHVQDSLEKKRILEEAQAKQRKIEEDTEKAFLALQEHQKQIEKAMAEIELVKNETEAVKEVARKEKEEADKRMKIATDLHEKHEQERINSENNIKRQQEELEDMRRQYDEQIKNDKKNEIGFWKRAGLWIRSWFVKD